MSGPASAAERWRLALAEWAIPEPILAAAPESPWVFPTELFARHADDAVGRLTISNVQALDALPEGGSVLDVGCGAGAASLPLARRAASLIGVDSSEEMLAEFQARAGRISTAVTIKGRWPEVAASAPLADVAVCHHVAYNAPDLGAFALALTDHARRRVVMELTLTHPQDALNDLWLRFHGLRRPTRPTADDAEEVMREAGLDPSRADWQPPPRPGFAERGPLVAWVRRRLCLPADRDPEIEEALAGRIVEVDGRFGLPPRPVVTLWWEGRVA